MNLIRGCESQYSPAETGGLRLSTPAVYRNLGEEDGIGDEREGELRVALTGSVEHHWTDPLPFSIPNDKSDFDMQFAPDEPVIEIRDLPPGETREFKQSVRVGDEALYPNPFLFCLAREPNTKQEWDALRAALPQRYDTWTLTRDVDALQFEIECGIHRWLKLNKLTRHEITRFSSWVSYSYEAIPAALEIEHLNASALLERHLQKRRIYKDQQEYRLGWIIKSSQMPTMPNAIDIELTKTGLSMFEPWEPPTVTAEPSAPTTTNYPIISSPTPPPADPPPTPTTTPVSPDAPP